MNNSREGYSLDNITQSDIERFVAKEGKKAQRTLSILGKNEQLLKAIQTPIGQELLSDALSSIDHLLEKIIDEKADDKDRADYRALRTLTTRWTEKIKTYQEALHKVKNT